MLESLGMLNLRNKKFCWEPPGACEWSRFILQALQEGPRHTISSDNFIGLLLGVITIIEAMITV